MDNPQYKPQETMNGEGMGWKPEDKLNWSENKNGK